MKTRWSISDYLNHNKDFWGNAVLIVQSTDKVTSSDKKLKLLFTCI